MIHRLHPGRAARTREPRHVAEATSVADESCRAVLWSRAVVRKSGFVSTPVSRARAASYR